MEKPIAYDIYEAIAEKYSNLVDTAPFNAFYERPAIVNLIDNIEGLKVLDLGCGNGYYTELLLNRGAESIVGIDCSPKMVKIALKRVGDRAKIFVANLEQPLEILQGECFDLIVSSLVLHYIENWERLFKELNSYLKVGGKFVFSVSHPMTDFKSSQSQNYFEVELIREQWPSYDIMMPTFRRSFNYIFNTIIQTGFVLEDFLEPLPLAELEKINENIYNQLSKTPTFLCLKVRKNHNL